VLVVGGGFRWFGSSISMSSVLSGCTGGRGVILVLAMVVNDSVRLVCEYIVSFPPPRPAVGCLVVAGAFLMV
jgi:hypothetical protein